MRPAQQAEEERHDRVSDLLGSRGVDVDQAEPEVGGESRVDGAVGGAEAEDELVGAEAALSGAWEVSEGVEENGRRRLDLALGQAAEWHVLHGCHAG